MALSYRLPPLLEDRTSSQQQCTQCLAAFSATVSATVVHKRVTYAQATRTQLRDGVLSTVRRAAATGYNGLAGIAGKGFRLWVLVVSAVISSTPGMDTLVRLWAHQDWVQDAVAAEVQALEATGIWTRQRLHSVAPAGDRAPERRPCPGSTEQTAGERSALANVEPRSHHAAAEMASDHSCEVTPTGNRKWSADGQQHPQVTVPESVRLQSSPVLGKRQTVLTKAQDARASDKKASTRARKLSSMVARLPCTESVNSGTTGVFQFEEGFEHPLEELDGCSVSRRTVFF